MTSTTEDFSDVKKSSTFPFVARGTQSVAREKRRKPMHVAPLNLTAIKKELEEANKLTATLMEEVKHKEEIKNQKNETVRTSDEKNSKDVVSKKAVPEPSVPAAPLIEVSAPHDVGLEIISKQCTSDSFDLDFSLLPLETPVKKVDNFLPSKTFLNKRLEPQPVLQPILNVCSSATKPFYKQLKYIEYPKENQTPNSYNNKPPAIISNPFNFDTLVIKNKLYVILNTLGKGGSSEVVSAFCATNKRLVAIKCVSLDNPDASASYINEVHLLQRLQHCDKVIKMYDFEIKHAEKKLLVVLEKGGEDFYTIMKNLAAQRDRIPLYQLVFYWMEMLYAVKQIHQNGVIHADLKPANFLRSVSGLKLIDFGIASSVQGDMTSILKGNPEGTGNYVSPEAISQDCSHGTAKYKLHFKSDVWSLGCILYQLIYRRTPFDHLKKLYEKMACITNPNHKIDFPNVDWVPPRIIESIKKCLRYDVKTRPSVDELIAEYEAIA